ncbi:ACT domain-containing protein, partial [Escherichia sp. TWPC-MK]
MLTLQLLQQRTANATDANHNIVAIAQGSSERSISVVVNNDDATT